MQFTKLEHIKHLQDIQYELISSASIEEPQTYSLTQLAEELGYTVTELKEELNKRNIPYNE
jgi:predicted HTH domain antitoxin